MCIPSWLFEEAHITVLEDYWLSVLWLALLISLAGCFTERWLATKGWKDLCEVDAWMETILVVG